MNKAIRTISACLAVAGCATGTSAPPGTGTGGPPSGYADGSKTINSQGVTFTSDGSAVTYTACGTPGCYQISSVGAKQFTWHRTSDPNVIVIQLDGVEKTLTWDPSTKRYDSGPFGVYVEPVPGGTSTDGQLMLTAMRSWNDLEGMGISGLQTAPGNMPASGGASYYGVGRVTVFHGGNFQTGKKTRADATTVLDVDFSAGTFSGTLDLTESGNSSFGYEIPAGGTVLTLLPGTISGNGFSGNWTGNLADLHLSALNSATYQGAFFGPSANDVGGTLSATGTSALSTPSQAWIVGGFMGE